MRALPLIPVFAVAVTAAVLIATRRAAPTALDAAAGSAVTDPAIASAHRAIDESMQAQRAEVREPADDDAKSAANDPSNKAAAKGALQLSAQQKADALASVSVLLTTAQQHYDGMPFGTPDEQIASLLQALEVARYEAALEVIRDDEALAFAHGDAANAAQRALPGDWERVITSNAALLADGRPVDLLVPIDPKRFRAIAPLKQQLTVARDASLQQFVASFNAQPLEQRRSRIQAHFAALRALANRQLLTAAERQANKERLMDPRVRIDEVAFLVWPR